MFPPLFKVGRPTLNGGDTLYRQGTRLNVNWYKNNCSFELLKSVTQCWYIFLSKWDCIIYYLNLLFWNDLSLGIYFILWEHQQDTWARTCYWMYNAKLAQEFAKETRTLRLGDSGWPSEVDNNQMRATIKVRPLGYSREVANEITVDHIRVLQHSREIGKVKIL